MKPLNTLHGRHTVARNINSANRRNEDSSLDTSDVGLPFDDDYLDTQESIDQTKLREIFMSIWDPAIQIIEPTVTTGDNTQLLIKLCHKLLKTVEISQGEAVAGLLEVELTRKGLNRMIDHVRAGGKIMAGGEEVVDTSEAFDRVAELLNVRLHFYQAIATKNQELEKEIYTMIKLADSLLLDQLTKGEEIKAGVSVVRYTFTCKAISGQWATMGKSFATVVRLRADLKEQTAKFAGEKELIAA